MVSEALNKSARPAIGVFNINGVCYVVKLLRADKLLFCLRYGVVMLGTECAISKAIKLRLYSFRKVIMCLLNECTLWLAPVLCFDYTYYLKTKVSSLRLSSAKRLLRVASSSLFLRRGCASLTLLISSVFCARCHGAFCCGSVRFIKKIM